MAGSLAAKAAAPIPSFQKGVKKRKNLLTVFGIIAIIVS
jgi:hypothetical protein